MASSDPTGPREHHFILPEDLKEIQDAFAGGAFSEAVEKVQKLLESLENAELHIAVTGIAGTGKSTFVNAIRGLGHNEEGSAPTGNVQTTTKSIKYLHPKFKNVAVWDLPGIGTPDFEPQKYLKKVNFSQYDFFIIILSNRFTCNDELLAREIQKMGKNFYFVRSKIDSDLHASKRRLEATYDEDKEIQKINDYCLASMRKERIVSAPLFLVSSFDLGKYEFKSLANTLAKDLTANKKHAFLLSLPNVSLSILEKKKAEIKKHIWKVALKSGGFAAIPIPGLSIAADLFILKTALTHYIHCFGLDNNSLKNLAAKVGKPLHYITEVIKSPIDEEISNDMLVKLLTNAACSLVMIAEMVSKFIPIFGCPVGAVTSFAITYYMLNTFVDDLAGNAQRVLERALPLTKE